MLNIVIPMAGRGSRFQNAGYLVPKPLIPIFGKSMIELVVGNIRPREPHRFIFLVLEEHLKTYALGSALKRMAPGCEVISVAGVTEGAACTVLLAREFIDNADPLMIANSDQWVDVRIDEYLSRLTPGGDGLIMTMRADDPKWSFVGVDSQGFASEVVEKRVISNEATVGIYNFRHGRDFVNSAEQMIAKNLRVNNEFYVAPVYNEMIRDGKRILIHNIGKVEDRMYGLGTPEDLRKFIELPIARVAAGAQTGHIEVA